MSSIQTFGQQSDIVGEFASDYEARSPEVTIQPAIEPAKKSYLDAQTTGSHYLAGGIQPDIYEAIHRDIHDLRYLSGLEKYPYEDGIEGLRTSLICVLNVMADLVAELKRPVGHSRQATYGSHQCKCAD